MSKSAVYPKAIFADNGISGGTYTSGPPKLVLHTTETSGMPGYNNGNTAPHLTYDPRSRMFIQHRTFKTASRSLRNEPGGVQTNRDTALQIEIICYSSKPLADQQWYRDWVGDLHNISGALEDLSEFIDWVCDDWGIQKTWPGKQALSYSAANKSGFRMTPEEWDGYNGVCGHQHVPENTHWDPGALDWNRLLPATTQLSEEDQMTPEQEAKLDAVLAAVGAVPGKVWGTVFSSGGYDRSAQLALMRTEQATQRIELGVSALDLEGVSEAELDERVAELAGVIAAQPAAFVAKLKASL